MIRYIENKKVSFRRIEQILSKSKRLNHYTNNGPTKIALEKKLEHLLDIESDKKVICTSNGTAALHALMMLCKSRGLSKFVSPAFTFPSVNVGGGEFDVTILDIDQATYTLPLDKGLLQEYDVIVITNLFGTYHNLDGWVDFCNREGKVLIFDNASSPMSKYNGVNICNFGDYSFGSLHHTKYLGFGEGGFVVAPKKEYNLINSILNFGFYDRKEHKRLSSNFKMSDVSAAFIIQHIEQYDVDQHIKNQTRIIDQLHEIKNAQLFNYQPDTVYGTMPILFDINADPSYFGGMQIVANKYYKPLIDAENSNMLYSRIINFPLYASLTDKQTGLMIKAIKLYSESI